MMKDSSSCAIYGIKDSQKCMAAYSLYRVCECVCVWWRVIEVSSVRGSLSLSWTQKLHFIVAYFRVKWLNVFENHIAFLHPSLTSYMPLWLPICFSSHWGWSDIVRYTVIWIPSKYLRANSQSQITVCPLWCHPADLHLTFCRGSC